MHSDYLTFDKETGFSTKAGFQLATLQIQDVNTFVQWPVSLNRSDVGVGKTVVSTAVALMRGAETIIVAIPPILSLSWKTWLEKVSERVVVYDGTPAKRKKLNLAGAKWVIVSHALLRQDHKILLEELGNRSLELIVDEAHVLKNSGTEKHKKVDSVYVKDGGSKLFQAVNHIMQGHFLQMLTGTPTNSPSDAYAYIKLKNPTAYKSRNNFEEIHVAARNIFKKITKWQHLDKLAVNFAVNSIARTKEEVHGYNNPPSYPDTSYELSKDHEALYKTLVDEQLLLLPDGDKVDAGTAQKLFHNLQQIVVNYDHFSGDSSKRSAAYDMLDYVIATTGCLAKGKSKLIVWTVYKLTSRSVLNYLISKGYSAVAAYSEADSQKSVARFMEDESVRILVAQPSSAGAGLNPQHVCWESLFLESTTNPTHIIQACGRIDRVGQKHSPTIRFAVAKGTIQVKLRAQLLANDALTSKVESKKSLRDTLLGK